MTPIELIAGNKSLTTFKDAVISKSMVNFYSNYYFKTNDTKLGRPSEWGFHLDDAAQIKMYDKKIFDGWVEDIDLESSNSKGSIIEIYGRDKTCDLVDCPYDGSNREWKNQTAGSIVKNICSYFGISITIESSVQSQAETKIKTFKINEGQIAQEMIQKICTPLGILPYSKSDGKLTLGRATTTDLISGGIERGKNVLAHEIRLSNRNRYSKYIVKGMGIGDDNKSIEDWTQCSGEHSDYVVRRTRPMIMFSDNIAEKGLCKNYAKWIAWNRGCLSRLFKYTVSGWRTDNGDPWDINKLVKVKDPWFEIDETMLIIDLDFYLAGGQSSRTDLLVVNKNIFSFQNKSVDVKMAAFDV
jgi:prophage tail gpP-like protein